MAGGEALRGVVTVLLCARASCGDAAAPSAPLPRPGRCGAPFPVAALPGPPLARGGAGLGPEVGDVVAAAEFERHEVVEFADSGARVAVCGVGDLVLGGRRLG